MKIHKNTPFVVLLILAAAATIGVYYVLQETANPAQNIPVQPAPAAPPTVAPITQEPNPSPTPSSAPLTPPISAAELWQKREELVNSLVWVKDVISFQVNCPSIEPLDPDSCGTKVLIGPNPPQTDYFELISDGQYLECGGSPNTCEGFERGKIYTIAGTLVRCGYRNLAFCLDIQTR